MSYMPLRDEFRDAVKIDVTGDPALIEKFALSEEAQRIENFNTQNKSELHGHLIATNARVDGGDSGYALYDKDKEEIRYMRTMTALQAQDASMQRALEKLIDSISLPDIQSWSIKEKAKAWDEHRVAGREVEVPAQNVMTNPHTGMPYTRAELDMLNKQGTACAFAIPAEDLLRDDDGGYVMNASRTHYISATAQNSMDAALEKAALYEKLSTGEVNLASLSEEQRLTYLASLPPTKREEYYTAAGIDAPAMEEIITPYAPGVLGDIADPKTATGYGDITLNDGAITPGQFTLNNAFAGAALGMTPINAQFTPPAAASALQYKQEFTPGS